MQMQCCAWNRSTAVSLAQRDELANAGLAAHLQANAMM